MKKVFILAFIFLASGCNRTAQVPVASPKPVKENNMISITSSAFAEGQAIPEKYSCKGKNINPPLQISGVPGGVKSLALILHDPDAPMAGGFTHWVIYNIPPTTASIAENSAPPGIQGNNGRAKDAYTGPCPPSGTHRYYFYIYALDTELNFASPPDKTAMEKAMAGHIMEQGQLMGTFAH